MIFFLFFWIYIIILNCGPVFPIIIISLFPKSPLIHPMQRWCTMWLYWGSPKLNLQRKECSLCTWEIVSERKEGSSKNYQAKSYLRGDEKHFTLTVFCNLYLMATLFLKRCTDANYEEGRFDYHLRYLV